MCIPPTMRANLGIDIFVYVDTGVGVCHVFHYTKNLNIFLRCMMHDLEKKYKKNSATTI